MIETPVCLHWASSNLGYHVELPEVILTPRQALVLTLIQSPLPERYGAPGGDCDHLGIEDRGPGRQLRQRAGDSRKALGEIPAIARVDGNVLAVLVWSCTR